MRIKLVLLSGVLALFSVTLAVAQGNVSIGVRGGATIPGFTGGQGDPVSEGYSTALRMGAGIFAEFKISELFSIQPMLEYSQQGAKRNGMQAMVATASDPQLYGLIQSAMPVLQMVGVGDGATVPEYLYANAKRDAKMDYLMLPVLAKFGWNLGESSPWRVYVDAGPYIGLLLNAKNIVTGDGQVFIDKSGTQALIPSALLQIPDPSVQPLVAGLQKASDGMFGNQDIKDQLNKLNWGLEGNVGLQYKINPRNKVFIEVGGNYGLMNIQKSTGTDANGKKEYLNGKNNIGAATAMIGYAYTL